LREEEEDALILPNLSRRLAFFFFSFFWGQLGLGCLSKFGSAKKVGQLFTSKPWAKRACGSRRH
jgi:hypothetical protein